MEDVSYNHPNAALFALASWCDIGQCDAFISHSWSDDGAAKWAAMQSWRAGFVVANNREPRIWIDKWCIEQSNLEVDLRALPIYLHACRKLVVLCGTTYLSRLWCVLEMFAYVHMGGKIDDIELVPVCRDGFQQED